MQNWPLLVAALLGGGLLAALVALWRVPAERRKLRADAEGQDEENQQRRFDDARKLRPLLFECEDKCRKLEEENAQYRSRLLRAPQALIEKRLADLNGLRTLFDLLADPVVVTTSENGGTFVYANEAFCQQLQRSCDEIVSLGWRKLIHPADLVETTNIETEAWDQPIWGFVNRYIRKDGSTVWCRWFCKQYAGGMTIAVVRMSASE